MPDDTAFDELIPADQRAELAALPRDRLLAECLNALEDAALWHNCVQAEQAANAAWRREFDLLRRERDALRAELAATREVPV